MLHNSAYIHLTDQNSETFVDISSFKTLLYHATAIWLMRYISYFWFWGEKYQIWWQKFWKLALFVTFSTSTIATWELSNMKLRHRESASPSQPKRVHKGHVCTRRHTLPKDNKTKKTTRQKRQQDKKDKKPKRVHKSTSAHVTIRFPCAWVWQACEYGACSTML